jgi:MFS family permease
LNDAPTPPQNPSTGALPPLVRQLGWVSLLTDAASEMIYPLLPVFLVSLGGGAAALGALEGIAEATSALVKWWTGVRSDRAARRKPFVLLGYGLASFVRPLMAIAMAPWHVVLLRTIDRVGKGLRSAPRDAMLSDSVPARRRAAAFGFHRMMDNTGSVIGPILAFVLARAGVPLRWVFASALVPGLLAVATLAFGVREDAHEARAAREPTRPPRLPGVARGYLATVALFTLGASADSFLLLRMLDLGLAPAFIPLVWLSLSASKALTNVPGGRISDRFGHRPTLAVAWLLYAVLYASLPLVHGVAATWVLIVAYGAYYGLAEGAEKAVLADLVAPEMRGRAYGALHAITGACVLPANAMFGALYQYDVRFAFWVGAGFAALGAIALVLVTRRHSHA